MPSIEKDKVKMYLFCFSVSFLLDGHIHLYIFRFDSLWAWASGQCVTVFSCLSLQYEYIELTLSYSSCIFFSCLCFVHISISLIYFFACFSIRTTIEHWTSPFRFVLHWIRPSFFAFHFRWFTKIQTVLWFYFYLLFALSLHCCSNRKFILCLVVCIIKNTKPKRRIFFVIWLYDCIYQGDINRNTAILYFF